MVWVTVFEECIKIIPNMTLTHILFIRAGAEWVRLEESSWALFRESESLNTLWSIRSQNLYSLGKQCDSIIMNIVLALLVFQSAFLEAKICQIKQLVSKPVRQSYLENVRKTVSYPCCTNIACDPPVCKKVCAINVKCVYVLLNYKHSLICPHLICDISIS